MKYTLLEMTQRILESMGSDEVNSIFDTTESVDVSNIIKECYFNIMTELSPQESRSLFHLDSSGDSSKPILMTLPDSVLSVEFLKYNIEEVSNPNFKDLHYIPLEDMFALTNNLDVNDTVVSSMDVTINGGTFLFKYRNDQMPTYWTTVDDKTLIFDSIDESVDSILNSQKTYGFGEISHAFTMSDSFVPKLDAKHFQLLLNAAKAQANIEIKQVENASAEKKAKRNMILAKKHQSTSTGQRVNYLQRGFGRK